MDILAKVVEIHNYFWLEQILKSNMALLEFNICTTDDDSVMI